MNDTATPSVSELSRPIEIAALFTRKNMTMTIRASAEECQALAKRLGIIEVRQLEARLVLSTGPVAGNFRIDGHLDAVVVQPCTLSFEPVEEIIGEDFTEILTTRAENLKDIDDTARDDDLPVDLVEGETLDAGEIVAQWLSLGLNPYPRSDKPVFEHNESTRAEDGSLTHTPFSVLENMQNLKKKS